LVKPTLAARYDSPAALLAELAERDGQLYRVELHRAGDDPRIALRARDDLQADDLAELLRRLERLDAVSRSGPWTTAVLTLIASRSAVRAALLARELGLDAVIFKRNVRKLKELGLTESLGVGYRLSPRGHAVLRTLAASLPSNGG
jgi:hypothetical protein